MQAADTKRKTLQGKVREYVQPGSEVYTDTWIAYTGLDAEYVHNEIDHSEAYAVGKGPHERDCEFMAAAQAQPERNLRRGQALPSVPLPGRAGVSVQQPQDR